MPAFPLMYISNGEAKASGLLSLALIILTLAQARRHGLRTRSTVWLAVSSLVAACTAIVLYTCTNGPAWILFLIGALAVAFCLLALSCAGYALAGHRHTLSFAYLAGASIAVIAATAAFWYAARAVRQSPQWMHQLWIIDNYAAWLASIAIGAAILSLLRDTSRRRARPQQ